MREKGKAIEWLRLAVEWYPKRPWQWAVQLGDWLAEAGDKEGALESYWQALE
jgi:Flp pilus assembly protein TadD